MIFPPIFHVETPRHPRNSKEAINVQSRGTSTLAGNGPHMLKGAGGISRTSSIVILGGAGDVEALLDTVYGP
jgi:hypothetical protein